MRIHFLQSVSGKAPLSSGLVHKSKILIPFTLNGTPLFFISGTGRVFVFSVLNSLNIYGALGPQWALSIWKSCPSIWGNSLSYFTNDFFHFLHLFLDLFFGCYNHWDQFSNFLL